MAGITHAKVSAVADAGDSSLVQPSDWNAEHVIPDGAIAQAKVAGLVADLAGKQPVDADLTAIAELASTGLVERTGAGTAATRALGVAADTSVPTRADADARYAAASHGHAVESITGLAAIATSGSAADLSSGTLPLARLSGITDAEIAAGNKDGLAATASMRTLGTGATQAAAGDHGHAGTYQPAGSYAAGDGAGNLLAPASTPAAPDASRVNVHGLSLAGRVVPGFRSADGAPQALAQHLGTGMTSSLVANNNSISPTTAGLLITTNGTTTARAVSAGSFFSWCRRMSMVSASTTGASAELRSTSAYFGRGDAAGAGGFTFSAIFGIGDAAPVANARMFVGLYSTVGNIVTVQPSSLLNTIGIGCDAGEATLSIIHNDGAGTATKIDLGANFPADTQNTDVYRLVLYAAPNASTVGYRVTRLNTGHEASGTISTDLPASSQMLSLHLWRNNGTTALAVDLAIMRVVIDTDN